MNKVWIFFKLRILQLRYDKAALFFSYILPVLLLMGIGYPMEMLNNAEISVNYVDNVKTKSSEMVISKINASTKINLEKYDTSVNYQDAIRDNEIKNMLVIGGSADVLDVNGTKPEFTSVLGGLTLHLYSNDQSENVIESKALARMFDEMFSVASPEIEVSIIKSDSISSYIVTLLPGLMGMTLLIIGLNGFGAVLIEEAHEGLFRNIKTIDASPIPFLSGLLLSRLLVSYTVASALFLIGIFMFGLNYRIDLILFLLVLTLGCIAFLGIGLVIAVFSPSVNSFNGIVNFVEIPFVVFSGVFFSIKGFPDWLQVISNLIPLTHMNSALQSIIFDGTSLATIGNISTEVMLLLSWCLITLIIGWKKFRW